MKNKFIKLLLFISCLLAFQTTFSQTPTPTPSGPEILYVTHEQEVEVPTSHVGGTWSNTYPIGNIGFAINSGSSSGSSVTVSNTCSFSTTNGGSCSGGNKVHIYARHPVQLT